MQVNPCEVSAKCFKQPGGELVAFSAKQNPDVWVALHAMVQAIMIAMYCSANNILHLS